MSALSSKAARRWSTLRNSVKDPKFLSSKLREDLELRRLTHGLNFDRRIHLPKHWNVISVYENPQDSMLIFICEGGTLITVDGPTLQFRHQHQVPEAVDHIAFIQHTGEFLAWKTGQPFLLVLHKDLTFSTRKNLPADKGKIMDVFISEKTGEIVTVHLQLLLIFRYRLTEKHMDLIGMLDLPEWSPPTGQSNWIMLNNPVEQLQVMLLCYGRTAMIVDTWKCKMIGKLEEDRCTYTAGVWIRSLNSFLLGNNRGIVTAIDQKGVAIRKILYDSSQDITYLAEHPAFPGHAIVFQQKRGFVTDLPSARHSQKFSLSLPWDALCPCYTNDMLLGFHRDSQSLVVWKINSLCQLLVTFPGSPVRKILQAPKQGTDILKVAVLLDDGMTTVVNSSSGHIRTLEGGMNVTVGAYSGEYVYMATRDGLIQRSSVDTLDVDQLVQVGISAGGNIAVDFIAIIPYEKTEPLASKRSIVAGMNADKFEYLVVLCDSLGWMTLFDPEVRQLKTRKECHDCRLISMTVDVDLQKIFTTAFDMTVKIWMIDPKSYSIFSLTTLSFSNVVHLVAPLHSRFMLGMDTSGPGSMRQCLVYDIFRKSTFKQEKASQHTADVTVMLSYKTFGFFVTAAADQTIRLWNSVNRIFRIIELPASPISAAFLGHTANLVFASREDLWILPARNYLPRTMLSEHELIEQDALRQLQANRKLDATEASRVTDIPLRKPSKGKDALFVLDTEIQRIRNLHLKSTEEENPVLANNSIKPEGDSKPDVPLESLAPDETKIHKMDEFCSKMAVNLSKIKSQRQPTAKRIVS